jgi:hypothetical protein
MTDRSTKERKLMALIITDLELDLEKMEMVEVEKEVRALSNQELDKALASRLELPNLLDEQAMEEALSHIEEPQPRPRGEARSVSGTTDTSHELRPEADEG